MTNIDFPVAVTNLSFSKISDLGQVQSLWWKTKTDAQTKHFSLKAKCFT